MLVEEVDGERRQTLQVLLSLMADGSWQIALAERPGWTGRHSEARFETEEEARGVLDAIYAKAAHLGRWHLSRFGKKPFGGGTTESNPHW